MYGLSDLAWKDNHLLQIRATPSCIEASTINAVIKKLFLGLALLDSTLAQDARHFKSVSYAQDQACRQAWEQSDVPLPAP